MPQEIVLTIDADGVAIEVNGVKGKGCTSLTAALVKALGGSDKVKTKKEYNEPTQVEQRESARIG